AHIAGSALAHRTAGPTGEMNEARGRGFLHGAGRSESWAPHDIRYVVPTGPPSHFPRPLSSPSVPHHLYRGPKSRGRNLKAPPAPIAGSALATEPRAQPGKC